ncbi:MAG: hypothetical protein LBL99_04000 [Holosporaceae bacterium]|nr:hypothetical protein [Holosporaceae bacterium]
MIETALTLPIISYLIFFTFELMKIHITQTAIDTIAAEATFYFIAKGRIADGDTSIDKIVKKHIPSFIQKQNLGYWLRVYSSLENMCSKSPFGGESIGYHENAETYAYLADHTGIVDPVDTFDFIDSDGSKTFKSEGTRAIHKGKIRNNEKVPSGVTFVLTVVCNYVFSSSFIKMLFAGGSNTIRGRTQQRGEAYVLWGRGVGIVN